MWMTVLYVQQNRSAKCNPRFYELYINNTNICPNILRILLLHAAKCTVRNSYWTVTVLSLLPSALGVVIKMNQAKTQKEKVTTRKGCQTSSVSNTALTAVAFQDHMMRSLSLQDPLKKKKINHKLPVAPRNKNKLLSTASHKPRKSVPKEEKEYVLDPKPPSLTLAQKLGLVEAPAQPLTDDEWKVVKAQSSARDDSVQPCVICKEDFGVDQQVLLSCSHVFHRICLLAFERFSGRKTCPMCRKEEYQTRVIYEGARHHRERCATRIQAAWRGYLVRSWYKKLRQTVPPKDPKLRQKFYEEKFQSITDRIVNSMEANSKSIDHLFQEIDQSIAASRRVMRHVGESRLVAVTDSEWEQVQLKAVQRCDRDCPICIMPLAQSGAYHRQGVVGGDQTRARPTVLLSCSHVFHTTCLEAFEEFSLDSRHVCPVCRSTYTKKAL